MSPIWKSLSRNVASQPRRRTSCILGGLTSSHGCAFSSSAMSSPYDENEEMPTAPSEKVLKIVEDISGLTLLEAADMSLLLKKKLRIQNVPVMSMGMNVMHDMWYETLPPPIGPKRMIPSRNFGDGGRRATTSETGPVDKVDELQPPEWCRGETEGMSDGEWCEEEFVETTEAKDASESSKKSKKKKYKPCTQGAMPAAVKPTVKKQSSKKNEKKEDVEKAAVPAAKKAKAATPKAPKPKTTKTESTKKSPKAKSDPVELGDDSVDIY